MRIILPPLEIVFIWVDLLASCVACFSRRREPEPTGSCAFVLQVRHERSRVHTGAQIWVRTVCTATSPLQNTGVLHLQLEVHPASRDFTPCLETNSQMIVLCTSSNGSKIVTQAILPCHGFTSQRTQVTARLVVSATTQRPSTTQHVDTAGTKLDSGTSTFVGRSTSDVPQEPKPRSLVGAVV